MIFATDSDSKSGSDTLRDRSWMRGPDSVSDSESDSRADSAQVTGISIRAGRQRAPCYRRAPMVVSVSFELEGEAGVEELQDSKRGMLQKPHKYF